MSSFGTDFDVASEAIAEAFSDEITYTRGATTLTVQAIRVQPTFLVDGSEVRIEHIDAAFDIAAADLDDLSPPERGDRVGDGELFYEVLPAPGGRCYSEADPDGTRLVVYAKRVGA